MVTSQNNLTSDSVKVVPDPMTQFASLTTDLQSKIDSMSQIMSRYSTLDLDEDDQIRKLREENLELKAEILRLRKK